MQTIITVTLIILIILAVWGNPPDDNVRETGAF